MDRIVTLSKHEMIVDRDDYEELLERIVSSRTKTFSTYTFDKDSQVLGTLIECGQEEHMVLMEEVYSYLYQTDEFNKFIKEVDTSDANCLLIRGW